MKRIAILALAAISSTAFGQLWDQGNLVNVPGGGTGAIAGMDLSQLENTPVVENIFGFGAQTPSNNVMADDFTVGAGGWNITGLRFYTYQTGATAPSITGVSWAIDSDLTSTAVTSSAFSVSFTNIFRVTSTDTAGSTRRIQQVDVTGLNINLAPGTYFLKWNFAGSLASGPWAPPLPTSNAVFGQNAQQSLANAAFAPAFVDAAGTLGADGAFQIYGDAVPEPATMTLLALGAAGIAARRRKNSK